MTSFFRGMDDVAPLAELAPLCAGTVAVPVPGGKAGTIGVASYVPINGREMK